MLRAKQVPQRSAGKLDRGAYDGTAWLDGDTFTGTPTATEQTTSDLTITAVQVNTSILTIDGESVAVGAAIQLKIDGGTSGVKYDVLLECDTTDGREFGYLVSHECV